SHRNAAAAWKQGFFDDLVVPFADLKYDNNVRADTSLEKLSSLRTAFDKSPAGTLTAGNSSPLTDGAGAVLLGCEEWARAHRGDARQAARRTRLGPRADLDLRRRRHGRHRDSRALGEIGVRPRLNSRLDALENRTLRVPRRRPRGAHQRRHAQQAPFAGA